MALYLTGNYRDAARAYRAGLKGQLSLPYLYDPAGYWAFRTGDFDEAERRARTTLALVPSALEPQITLAELALERGKPTEAVKAFAAVLHRHPDHVDALVDRREDEVMRLLKRVPFEQWPLTWVEFVAGL